MRSCESDFRRLRGSGFAEVTFGVSSYRVTQDTAAGPANLSFEIAENRKAVVQEIVLEGNTKTGDHASDGSPLKLDSHF